MSEKVSAEAEISLSVRAPKRYQVILHNDHYSTWEFVIAVLESVFRKSKSEAEYITSHVHHKGFGVCGVFAYEIAEMKVLQVQTMAKQHKYPLKCTMQEI
ncbi:ATP-dependent Clp protease adapter protein ClpS [Campylobacterota bacterium]|nr:ATP-dependent Clp protease adapter protein ClpS [Campylobacterota bacterium]